MTEKSSGNFYWNKGRALWRRLATGYLLGQKQPHQESDTGLRNLNKRGVPPLGNDQDLQAKAVVAAAEKILHQEDRIS